MAVNADFSDEDIIETVRNYMNRYEAGLLEELKKGVTGNLRSIADIRSTMTMIAVNE